VRWNVNHIAETGLVLYLPLYELDGGSFMSGDAYGHLCTVTGVLWGPDGGYFDGVDDKINCGSSSVLNFTSEDFSLEAWVKTPLEATVDIISRNEYETINGYFLRLVTDGRIALRTHQAEVVQTTYSSTSTAVADTWMHIVGTRSGAKVKIYKDGTEASYSTQDTHINPGSYSGDFLVGLQPSGTRAYKGYIGEVRVYNRALAPQEVQRHFLATKWRYK
jgi:hypothetical protein